MTRRIGIFAAFSKPEAGALADEITAWLSSRKIEVVPESQLSENAVDDVEAIIVLGGDGLMMRSAKAYPDTPLLGINFGKVGFLALAERRDWQSAIDALLRMDYQIEETATLEATIERSGESLPQGWAINDIVIRSELRMIEVETYVDDYFVNVYPGDGMIVSTSRGSTAYCMAAGGPILTSGVRGFAIVPISCHSPIRTPLVVGESQAIDLVYASRHAATLIIDGRAAEAMELNDLIRIRRGEHQFKLVTVPGTNFYGAFQSKFNFRIRPGAKPSRTQTPDHSSRPET